MGDPLNLFLPVCHYVAVGLSVCPYACKFCGKSRLSLGWHVDVETQDCHQTLLFVFVALFVALELGASNGITMPGGGALV